MSFAKRAFDCAGALVGLLLLSPLLSAVALLVWASSGGPVLYRQWRPGKDAKPFRIIKFRTMRTDGGTDGQRVTRCGRYLRRWSLDELPELVNVLRGEMSMVGPRPLLVQYLDRYTARQARRHEVRPGLTGWTQVNGRNALSWEEKLDLDVWYVENWTLRLDAVILWRTVRQVLRREGISHPGSETMPEFMGTSSLRDERTERRGKE